MQHLLNYGMVTHLMLSISKCLVASVIFLESRNGKFDAKIDEGIFLGYSTRSKAYKCLNANTNKVVKSANVKFYEHVEVQDNASIKKLEKYKSFVYFYEGMPTKEEAANQGGN